MSYSGCLYVEALSSLVINYPQWGPKVVWMKMDFIWKDETYNVYMTHGLPRLACAKYQDHIVVVKQGDHSNYDYLCLTAVRMRGVALQNFIK